MAEIKTVLTAPQVRGLAVCDGGGYQDDKTANWEFTDDGLQKFSRAIEAAVLSANAGKVDDTERLDWLDRQGFAYGFQDIHEGNRWEIYGGYMNLRDAIDCGIKCDTYTQSTGHQNVSIKSQNIDTSEKT